MFVRDHMTPDLRSVRPGTHFEKAAQMLATGGLHQLPVVNDENELAGIVTNRNIRLGRAVDVSPYDQLEVAAVMTRDPLMIDEGATIEDAVVFLYEHQFGALPVVRGGKLVGIITKHDVIKVLYDRLRLNGSRAEVASPHSAASDVGALQATTQRDELLSIVAAPLHRDCINALEYLDVKS